MNRTAPRWRFIDGVRGQTKAGELNSSANHIALALAVFWGNGKGAWPSQAELAASTGLSRRSVVRGLAELEQHGLIEHSHGARYGNVYRFPAAPGGRS